MKDRLQILLDAESISSARLAELVGVQPSAISHILSGRNKPGFDFIANLLSSLPTINPRWLLLGEGDVYLDTPSMGTVSAETQRKKQLIEPSNINIAPSQKSEQTRVVTNVTNIDESETQDTERVIILYKNGSFKEYFNK